MGKMCGTSGENRGTFSGECRTFSRHTGSNGATGRHSGTEPARLPLLKVAVSRLHEGFGSRFAAARG